MINALFFGINVILLLIAWKYMFKPSVLDHYRDKLFDLRESVRSYYIERDISLDDHTYQNLRGMLNYHLRFTQQMSLFEVAYFVHKLEKNPELKQAIKESIDRMFKTDDKQLEEFILRTRVEARKILINYLVFSSAPLLLVLSVTVIALIPRHIMTLFKQRMEYFRQAVIVTSRLVTDYVASGESVEKVSLETSSTKHIAITA